MLSFNRLHLKEEATDFLEEHTLKDLVKKYSQFINFDIFLWTSKVCVFKTIRVYTYVKLNVTLCMKALPDSGLHASVS